MQFRFTEEEVRFREEVRDVLVSEMQALRDAADAEGDGDGEMGGGWSPEFSRRLGARGWICLPWPKQYGGSALSFVQQMIFNEEVGYLRAPIGAHRRGLFYAAPILMLYGTEAQKSAFLPRIAAGAAFFCQGFSEPGAGSDLAALQTRALKDGDSFVVNGSKIWTSDAHRADFMFLAARTDPDAPKHRGISNFLVDMRTPGITVRPLVNMAGIHSFNQIYFDNVRIPADMLVGELNRGWYQTAVALDFERSSISSFAGLKRTLDDLTGWLRDHGPVPPRARMELSDAVVANEVGRMLAYRIVSMQTRGEIPNKEASMAKLFSSELSQRVAGIGVRLLGIRGGLLGGAKATDLERRIARGYLTSVSATIGGGTSEIQRNVIAGRGLGLPRG